jgi:hypothetical protein
MKKQICICGRKKSDHYQLTIRRKRRKLPDCKKFRPAPIGGPQTRLNFPPSDNLQPASNQKNS